MNKERGKEKLDKMLLKDAENKKNSKPTGSRNRNRNNKWEKEGNEGRDGLKNKSNDPSWYYSDAQILKDVASLPFSHAAGTPVKLADYSFVVPGLMTLELLPTLGYSEDQASALNTAAFGLYTYVRHANSGHTNYDAPDLMLYIGAMSQIYSFINFAQRIYGCAMLYSQQNRYLPRLLIEAQQVDFTDLISNLANFRAWLNMLITKTASFSVPAQVKLFMRQSFLYQNIYIEGTSIKDQMYMYVPYGFMQYQLNDDGSGMLGVVPWKRQDGKVNPYTVAEIIAYGEQLVSPLIESEDLNIMSGDILKAYGGDTIKLSLVPESYTIAPIMDIRVLEQMKNATCVGDAEYSVVQDSTHAYLYAIPGVQADNLVAAPNAGSYSLAIASQIAKNFMGENRLLTTTTHEVTPELIMENTRLMAATYFDYNSQFDGGLVIKGGTEIVRYMHVWGFDTGANSEHQAFTSYPIMFQTNPQDLDDTNNWLSNNFPKYITQLSKLSHFDFHPMVHVFIGSPATGDNGTGSKAIPVGIFLDLDNYATIDPDELARMDEAALIALLNIPWINISR